MKIVGALKCAAIVPFAKLVVIRVALKINPLHFEKGDCWEDTETFILGTESRICAARVYRKRS